MENEKTDTRKAMDAWVGKMTDDQAKEEFKRLKFEEFKIKYRNLFEMWFNAHGTAFPPVRWDPQLMDYIWLNREQRRKMSNGKA